MKAGNIVRQHNNTGNSHQKERMDDSLDKIAGLKKVSLSLTIICRKIQIILLKYEKTSILKIQHIMG